MTAISSATVAQTASKALGTNANNPQPVRESVQVDSTNAANVAQASQGSSQETIASPIKLGKEQTIQNPKKVQNSKDPSGRSSEDEEAKDEASKDIEKFTPRVDRFA